MSDQNQQPEKTSEPVTPKSKKEPELLSVGQKMAEDFLEAVKKLHLPHNFKNL